MIDGEGRLDAVRGHGPPGEVGRGVADEHVEPGLGGADFLGEPADLFLDQEIGDEEPDIGISRRGDNLGTRGLAGFPVAAGHQHRQSPAREGLGCGPADAPICARDQTDLPRHLPSVNDRARVRGTI